MIKKIKKIIPAASGLIFFIATFLLGQKFLQKVSADVVRTATLTLSSTTLNPQVNQEFSVGIGLNSASNIVGVDAQVYFDSRYLEVVSASLGNTDLKTLVPGTDNTLDLTKAVTINAADPAKSTVEIGLVAFDQSTEQLTTPVTGNFDASTNPIARIVFKGKAAGQTNLSFKFDGKGITTDSNVVTNDSGTPEDILTAPQTSLAINVIYACTTVNVDNTNNVIDIADIQAIAGRWNVRAGNPLYETKYDLNQDEVIDISDLQSVAGRYGEICK